MPFWKRKPKDPEVEAARAEAEASLPQGWTIDRVDYESFRLPKGLVETYGVCAAGPGGEAALVVAVGEANALRQFTRFMRGELTTSDGWAVPIPPLGGRGLSRQLSVRNFNDPEVLAAKEELDAAVPPGWRLYMSDRERYFFPNGYLETWAVAATGPGGEAELVMGIHEDGAFRTLAKRLRGELDVSDAWAAPMERFTPK